MSRSAWKPLFVHPQYIEGIATNEIKRQNRSIAFTKKIIGQIIYIYNGIRWYTIKVSEEILDQSIGKFAPTPNKQIKKKKTKNIK